MKDEWDSLVDHSNGTFLMKRDYMDYHSDRFDDKSLLVRYKDRTVGVFPAVIIEGSIVSHAGLTYGGLIHNNEKYDSVKNIINAINKKYRTDGVKKVIYKKTPHIYNHYPYDEDLIVLFELGSFLESRSISTVVPIADKIKFSKSRIAGIKKARLLNCQIRRSYSYSEFWNILKNNLIDRHNARPVHSLEEIELLASKFPDEINLFEVALDNRILAGCVLYNTGRVNRVQYIASTPEGRSYGCVDFLFDYVINDHCLAHENTYLDFGTSVNTQTNEVDVGLVFQKEGFGGRAVCYDVYSYMI